MEPKEMDTVRPNCMLLPTQLCKYCTSIALLSLACISQHPGSTSHTFMSFHARHVEAMDSNIAGPSVWRFQLLRFLGAVEQHAREEVIGQSYQARANQVRGLHHVLGSNSDNSTGTCVEQGKTWRSVPLLRWWWHGFHHCQPGIGQCVSVSTANDYSTDFEQRTERCYHSH
jgi:hypothetical protein